MGKKKSEIQGAKLLRKQIPYCNVYPDDPENPNSFALGPQGGGWELYTNTPLGMTYAVWRGYYDIAGWNKEQLSAFIEGTGWQEANEWLVTMLSTAIGARHRIKTWDILSKAVIPNAALDTADTPSMGIWLAPGFAGSNYNLEEIFGGRYRHFDFDPNIIGGFNQTAQEIWGAGDATAGDKIHITRIVKLDGIIEYNGLMVIPPQDVITNAIVVDEKDLVYMERLRRSYVLGESRNP